MIARWIIVALIGAAAFAANGETVERTVRFEARDVMAMMLPELPEQAVEGVAAYPLPPKLENRSNRGVATAQRGWATAADVVNTWPLLDLLASLKGNAGG